MQELERQIAEQEEVVKDNKKEMQTIRRQQADIVQITQYEIARLTEFTANQDELHRAKIDAQDRRLNVLRAEMQEALRSARWSQNGWDAWGSQNGW